MRQLNNTQNTDPWTKPLQNAGILQENIDWMVPYLDISQTEQPELLERAVRQDLGMCTPEEQFQFTRLFQMLLEEKDIQLRLRAMKASFAVMGASLMGPDVRTSRGRYWSQIAGLPVSLEELLTPEGAASLYAAGWCYGGAGSEVLLRFDPAVLEGALAYCAGPADPVRLVLRCVWLAQKGRPNGGLLKTLLGGGKDETAQAVQEVQEGVIALLPQAGFDPHSAAMPRLTGYIRQGEDGPLPVQLQRPAQYYNALSAMSAVGGACFLAMENAPALRPAFVVCADIFPGSVLARGLKLAGGARFRSAVPWLAERTPFSAVLPILARDSVGLAKDIYRQYPGVFEKALEKASEADAEVLLQIVQSVDPRRAKLLGMANKSNVQSKIVRSISGSADAADQGAMEDFLRNGTGLDALLVKYPVGAGKNWGYHGTVDVYARAYGTDAFVVRCLIATSMLDVSYHVGSMWREATDALPPERKNAALLDLALEAGLPPVDCLRLAEAADKGLYSQKDKDELMDQAARWLGERSDEVLSQTAEKGSAYGRCAAVKAYAQRRDVDKLTALTGDSSKQVRQLAANALAVYGLEAAGPAAVTLLGSKQASQREAALTIIDLLDQKPHLHGKFVQAYRPQLEQALAKEKSDKLAVRLRRLLGVEQEGDADKAGGLPGDPITETLKGGKKRKVQWVLDGQLPPVRNRDGSPAAEERLAAMMVCILEADLSAARVLATAGGQSEVYRQSLEDKAQAAVRGLDTARKLAEELERRSLEEYAQGVYALWLDQGAVSKQKWVLTFAALFGGREMVDMLKKQINQWPQEARGAIACEAVYALALSPEPEGLLLVDSISRKFKFKQVKNAAGVALSSAAKALNLTPEELADRIVPDLGLDQRGKLVFDYGPRSFTVTLTPALELEVHSQEGKKLKTLPAPGKQDDPALAEEASAAFKALKKQIKATVTTQALRLEQALSAARTWTGTAWRALFVQKPVMRQFAIGLVWGVYENGQLSACFRYLEDGSFSTVDEEEYDLADGATVGLVHPVELSQEELSAWQEQLEDYEIRQPIPQLERPVARVEPEHAADKDLEQFGGKVLSGLSLSGKLLGMGWYRGVVEDAGIFYSFYRVDGPIEIRLAFSGAYAGGGDDSEAEVWEVTFSKGPDPVPLGQVPPRLYSEIVYQLQKATASSAETRADWKVRAGRGI